MDVEIGGEENMEGSSGLMLDVSDDANGASGLLDLDVADAGAEDIDSSAPSVENARVYMEQLRSFLDAEGSASLLPNALTVPAVLHIIHNMLSELADRLTHWKIFSFS